MIEESAGSDSSSIMVKPKRSYLNQPMVAPSNLGAEIGESSRFAHLSIASAQS